MKKVAYYISDAGYGHVTRSLAVIEQILETTDLDIYLVCGEQQSDYAKIYLSKYMGRVEYKPMVTDAKVCYVKDSFDVDLDLTTKEIEAFLLTLNEKVAKEADFLREEDIEVVVTDISILGALVGKALGKRTVGISNYSWYHRYLRYGVDKELIAPYLEAYNHLDLLLALALSDDMSGIVCQIKEVGFISRRVDGEAKSVLKNRYWPSTYISIGMVADIEEIEVDFYSGHIFATGNTKITGNSSVAQLPTRVGHTQNYVAASSLAIVKPGWASVAECLTNGTPFGVIHTNVAEDGEILAKLEENGYCFVISSEELRLLDIKALNMRAAQLKNIKVENDVENIANILLNK